MKKRKKEKRKEKKKEKRKRKIVLENTRIFVLTKKIQKNPEYQRNTQKNTQRSTTSFTRLKEKNENFDKLSNLNPKNLKQKKEYRGYLFV